MKSILDRSFVLIPALVILAAAAPGCAADATVPAGTANGDAEGERVLSVHGGEPTEAGAVSTANVHGGTGGNDWVPIRCPTISGLHLRAATYVDNVQIECEGPGARWPGGYVGSFGGYDFGDLTCPDHYIATGVFGRSGTYLDSIGLICTNPISGAQITRGGGRNGGIGGDGGASFTDDCWNKSSGSNETAGGWKLIGFNARSASWIDAIAPVCGQLSPSDWSL